MSPSGPTTMTLKRIHKEISDLQKEDMGNMTLCPSDNLLSWSASLPGPEGSPYEGGCFKLSVELSPDYPFSAPKITFNTRVYHMNISDHGNVCLDILKQNWSPALSLFKVLLSLSSLLTDPNPKDPLVPSIASQYKRNRKLHDSTARDWTRLYASKAATPGSSKQSIHPTHTTAPQRRQPALPHNDRRGSGSHRPAPSNNGPETIIMIQSDSETEGTTRNQARGPRPKRQKRKQEPEIEVLDDEPAGTTAIRPRPEKRRRKAGPAASTGPTEVITIDDD